MSSGRFPETRYSILSLVRGADEETRRQALETVVEGYWKPVYKYLRLRWNLSPDDASDATQHFFLSTLERRAFAAYDPSIARFRTFLRVCLDRFMSNERKSRSRLKRGGALRLVSLDFELAEEEFVMADRRNREPEEFFHREWVRELLSYCLDEMQRNCREQNKGLQFDVFVAYAVEPTDPAPTYRQLAERFQIPETQITNYLSWARRRFRRFVAERIRELTGSDEEYRAELGRVLGRAR